MRNYNDIISDIYGRCDDESDRAIRQFEQRENESWRDDNRDDRCPPIQRHTHEYEGSVKIAERQEDPHNHRFAGVTGKAILLPNRNHFHELEDNTDFYEDHFHKVIDKTGPAIPVGNGRHVHFVADKTTVADGHRHEFQFATLIDNPIGD